MTFVLLKFLHVAFMFMGVAFALGPATMVFFLARSADPHVIRRTFGVAERLFDISTGCYAVGIALGIAAALSGSIDLTARWLVTAYALVAILGLHGVAFDRWTKRAQRAMADAGDATFAPEGSVDTRLPAYLLSAMLMLVILIVYVMVTKVTVL